MLVYRTTYKQVRPEVTVMKDVKQEEPRAFSTRRAARLLDMNEEALRYRIRAKQIRAVRIGRQYLVPAAEIDRLLNEVGRTEPGAER
jgi:excisionase family DNA binding protein